VDFKRLLGGLSALVMLAGLLLFTLTPGGPLNPIRTPHWTGDFLHDRFGLKADRPGTTLGLIFLGIGGIGLVLVICWRRRPGQPPFTLKRLLIAYALYALLLGMLFLTFGPGGLLNPRGSQYPAYQLRLDMPFPIAGWSLLGASAVALVVVWSLKPGAGGWVGSEAPPSVIPYTPVRPKSDHPDVPRPDPAQPDPGIYTRDPLKPPRE
jgi:hypothetical protein